MKRSGKTGGEPYCCLKILNMFLACGILLVAILIFVGDGDGILFPLEFLLGVLMCSLSGIMELSKGKGGGIFLFRICRNHDGGFDF